MSNIFGPLGGGAGGSGTGFFETTVDGGGGGDYTTLKAAVDAGYFRILVIGSTTETADITLSGNILIYILATAKVNMQTFRFLGTPESLTIQSSRNSNAGSGGGFTFAYSSSNSLITNISNLNIEGIRFDNNSTAANCWCIDQTTKETYISNCRFDLPNYRGCGVKLADTTGQQIIDKSYIIGGGTSCYEGIQATGSSICSKLHFIGTWSTSASQYALLSVIADNIYFHSGCRVRFGQVTNNVFASTTATGLIIELQFSKSSNFYLDTGDIYLISNWSSISNALLRNGNIIVNSNFDFCKIAHCNVGDTNGGANTITINTGCDDTLVIGCTTEAAISDNGTSSQLIGNSIF